MKTNLHLNRFFFFFLLLGASVTYGQTTLTFNPAHSGTQVNVGSTWTYTVVPSPPSTGDFYYELSNTGTIVSQTRNSVRIRWDQVGIQEITGYWDFGGNSYDAFIQIIVVDPNAPAKPATPTRTSGPCGDATVSRTGTPPFGVRWYWQTSSSTFNTNFFGSTFPVSSSGPVYLRPRNIYTNLWGPISNALNVTVTQNPAEPTYTITQNCDNTVLTRGNPPTGVTYYWQTTANGFSTSNSASQVTRTSGTVYYLRAKNNTVDCWSDMVTIPYTIKPTPGEPNAPGNAICGSGQVTLMATPGTNASTTRWYAAQSGGSYIVEGPNFMTPVLTTPTSYWVSSYSPGSGATPSCESARIEVDVNVASTIDYYKDIDDDKYAELIVSDCDPPGPGFVTTVLPLGDCDDNNILINPGTEWYVDVDGDGNAATIEVQCLAPTGGQLDPIPLGDCDDNDPLINAETIWYADDDNDGLGDLENPSTPSCTAPAGFVQNGNDQCPSISSPSNDCSTTEVLDLNYVYTRNYQEESQTTIEPDFFKPTDALIQQITYFDGLGRAKQQIGIDQSPNKKDILTHIEYDDFGRQVKEYLPYNFNNADPTIVGEYQSNAKNATLVHYFDTKYQNTTNPYSEKHFEPSPLNRTERQAAPGDPWKLDITGEDHSIEFGYLVNTATDAVKHFWANTVPATASGVLYYNPSIVQKTTNNGEYEPNQLYKNITKDENHPGDATKDHTIEEFTNKEGQVVLKRTYDNEVAHDTYYVYDDFGNLTYVLPPKMDGNTANMDELGYQYLYDRRNRLVRKKIAGKGWEDIVHNRLDQPVLTQDANLNALGQWLYTKYDAFGRVVYTGLVTNASARTHLQSLADSPTTYPDQYETITATPTTLGDAQAYYTNDAIPASLQVSKLHTINYYDDYDTTRDGIAKPIGDIFGQPLALNVRGLPTVSKVKVLDQNQWITTLTAYDSKGRPIYLHSTNEFLQTTDIVETLLDFVGRPIKTKTTHTRNGNTIVTIDNFTYDHVGRLLAQTQCIGDATLGDNCDNAGGGIPIDLVLPITPGTNVTGTNVASSSITVTNTSILPESHLYIGTGGSGEAELIVLNSYDELGRLDNKKVGGDADATDVLNSAGLQTVNFDYNVRDWLKSINDPNAMGDDLFAFDIKYEDVGDPSRKLYNGNISQTVWNSANNALAGNPASRNYVYTYDAMNRITDATGLPNTPYNVSNITYDKNGNIITLSRMGHTQLDANGLVTDFGDMDVLSYSYEDGQMSNKLASVSDSGSSTYGFKDVAGATDYDYDANGNMTQDLNKGIPSQGITYNHLNLPEQVSISGGSISYIYDAIGTKLKKTVSTGTETDYAGNHIYENNQLQFFSTPEGTVSPKDANNYSAGFDFVYNYVDQLGNVRLSYTDANKDGDIVANEIVSENNYYPFGLQHKGYNETVSPLGNSTAKKFKYNRKELEEELGKDTYAYGWRDYDPTIARFNKIDRFSEKYYSLSNYSYAGNNPVKFIDVQGDSIAAGSVKRAERMERRADKKAEKLDQRADRREARGKDVGDMRERATELRQSSQDIKDMRSDTNTWYKFERVNSSSNPLRDPNNKGLPATLRTGENEITMFMPKFKNMHEPRHGGQIARGDYNIVGIGVNGVPTAGYGAQEEISAYRAQYASLSRDSKPFGKISYIPLIDIDNPANQMRLIQSGGSVKAFKQEVNNINQINTSLLRNMYDTQGLNQQPIYLNYPTIWWNN